jgi:hypothetical protein
VRARPLTIGGQQGAARRLAGATGADDATAAAAIRAGLLAGCQVINPETDRPVFAFRLHQFVTRGDTVYAALQPEGDRHVTMQAQTYDPTDPQWHRVLLPLVSCRECGQDYYAVARLQPDEEAGTPARLLPRALGDQAPEQEVEGRPSTRSRGSARCNWPSQLNRMASLWDRPVGKADEKGATVYRKRFVKRTKIRSNH